jgi:hypothetical protein
MTLFDVLNLIEPFATDPGLCAVLPDGSENAPVSVMLPPVLDVVPSGYVIPPEPLIEIAICYS